jgi:hypothetical protein
MSAYPDWVNQHKTKGSTVKKVGNSYYLYKSTSKRVPGKKYPQPIQQFLGTITIDGFVQSMVRKVSTEIVKVYEYGLSYALSKKVPEKFLRDIGDQEKANYAFLNIVKHFSPESYLLRGIEVPSMEDLHLSLCVQKKKFERLAGFEINDLLPLTRVYLVETQKYDMISMATPEMRALMAKIGVNFDDIQK